MRCDFTAARGAGPERRDQYRLFLLKYPHLAAGVTVQRIADQKRTILERHLLSEDEIETIRMLVNHPPAGVVGPFKNTANKEIVWTTYDTAKKWLQ